MSRRPSAGEPRDPGHQHRPGPHVGPRAVRVLARTRDAPRCSSFAAPKSSARQRPTPCSRLSRSLAPQTHFVLLSSAADSLLPTIRSRTQRVRFGPLPDDAVASVLIDRGLPATEAAALSRLSNGSVATALGWSDPQAIAAREDFAARAVRALDSASAGPAFELAEDGKKVSKEVVLVQVRALAAALAEQGRAAASLPDSSAARAAARYGLALSAVEQIEANASVQLALEAMLLRMRAVP